MNVELITIGDEILTGHTIDRNASFIAGKLLEAGLNVRYKTTVGDNIADIETVMRQALMRARIVITTGGLGPTDDDLTKRALVKVFKRNLVFHEDILEDLKERFRKRDMEMPAINHNQALLPQGATFFPNKTGSALGICITEENRISISLPGVPSEMRQIITDEVIPFLSKLATGRSIKVIKLRTTGIAESKLAEMIKPELKLEAGVKLAYLPSFTGTDLRIIATDNTAEVAEEKANQLADYLEAVVSKYLFGKNDDTLEAVVGQLLKDNDKTVAVAESCTGGQLGMTFTSVAGASGFFSGGIITYDDQIKIDQLDVDAEIIKKHGAVSEECALAMAIGCRNHLKADYALSITGVAGPEGGSEEKPVGTIFIGLASAHTKFAKKFYFGIDRQANRTRSVYAAMELLRREILDLK